MPGAHKEGLLGGGMATSEGKHLYHETLPAVIVYTSDQEANARANGYEDEYIHQEYPKCVNGKTARNAAEEAAILGTPTEEVIE